MPSSHHGFIPSSQEDVLRRRVKDELRKRMRALRSVLPESACAERSSRIVESMQTSPVVGGARSIALFWPMEDRREVDLRPLDRWLRARSVRVAYPRIEDRGTMTFRFVASAEAMQPHPFGHFEAASEDPAAAPGELDAIVVPALAVDPRGHRIGYGAGHYDRALPSFSGAAVVAVVFDFQLIAEVPVTEGDVAASYVVTDRRTLTATRD